MCGIFGFLGNEESPIHDAQTQKLLEDLFHLSESRGKDSSGLAIRRSEDFEIIKHAIRASEMVKTGDFRQMVERNFKTGATGRFAEPVVAIGHSRMATNGLQVHSTNNQPVVKHGIVAIHNGIITNDEALWARYPHLKRDYKVDTEVLVSVLRHHLNSGLNLAQALERFFAEAEGTISTGLLFEDLDVLALASNFGSLYVYEGYLQNRRALVVFASERHSIEEIVKGHFKNRFDREEIFQVKPGTAYSYDLKTLERKPLLPQQASTSLPATRANPLKTRDLSHKPSDIKHCRKCILPATFPFIEFDHEGVCNLCRNYSTPQLQGEAELEKVFDRYRSSDGSPDCIIAFSGGRDSSYGLHLLKNKYGMKPIAFTYDWGMVTDLARRNQARMCGKLGVEHILVAADIAQKRRNIKMNVEAWMKNPHLGMIPLFMAGDKQFYYYARQVREQTGVKLVVFCAGNPLETTGFKSGFAGIRENDHNSILTGLANVKKLQMAFFYLGQFLKNPSYLNSSLTDTAFAFWSAYLQPDENVYLFRYLPWDEKLIESTLKREYGWETAAEAETTWRIGDGTASFYNYIYHTVAGFSEHDTFRSHQIRAGLITRDEAVKLAAFDNEPRFESMREYAQTVGFNLTEALEAIHQMPKLY